MIPKALPPLTTTSSGATGAGPAVAPGNASSAAAGPTDAFVAAPVDSSAATRLQGGPPSLSTQASLDAQAVASVAKNNPELAAKQFRVLLESHTEPDYRHVLTTEVAAKSPGVLEAAVKHELAWLGHARSHERDGVLNKVSNFFLDGVAHLGIGHDRGGQLESDVAKADRTYRKLEEKGPLDAAGAEQMQGLIERGVQDVQDYASLKNGVGRTVGSVGATLASIATGGKGGFIKAGLAAAAGEVAGKAALQGQDYDVKGLGRDAAVGFVSGAAASRVRALNPGERLAQRFHVRGFGSFLVSGATDGAALGAVNGTANGIVDDKTWDHGVGTGLLTVAQRAGMGSLVGFATGGTVGAASRFLSRNAGGPATATEGAAAHTPELDPALMLARNQGFSLLSTLEQQKLNALIQNSAAAREAVAQFGTQASGQTPMQQADQLRGLLPST